LKDSFGEDVPELLVGFEYYVLENTLSRAYPAASASLWERG